MTPEATEGPRTEIYTIHKPLGGGMPFDRIVAFCPCGERGTDTPVHTRLGKAFLAGDLTEEWCSRCGWEGEVL